MLYLSLLNNRPRFLFHTLICKLCSFINAALPDIEVCWLMLQCVLFCPYRHMDSPRKAKKAALNREPKRSQNQSSAPPQKDAYARLLSQHHSSKFSSYLEQYAKDTSFQWEDSGPSPQFKPQSDRQSMPPRQRDQVLCDFSDSSDFSPSSMKSKGEESSLSLYMEKLNTRNTQPDCERRQGVSDRQQRRGQRRDTTTSHDGDVDSAEELGSLKPGDSKKQQRKNKDLTRDAGSKETDPQSPKKAKKKSMAKHPEDGRVREKAVMSGVDVQMSSPKSPHGRNKNVQQPRGELWLTI